MFELVGCLLFLTIILPNFPPLHFRDRYLLAELFCGTREAFPRTIEVLSSLSVIGSTITIVLNLLVEHDTVTIT